MGIYFVLRGIGNCQTVCRTDADGRPAHAAFRNGDGGGVALPYREERGVFVDLIAVRHHCGEFGGIFIVASPPAEEVLPVKGGQFGEVIDAVPDRLYVSDRIPFVTGTGFKGHGKFLCSRPFHEPRVQSDVPRYFLRFKIEFFGKGTVRIPADKDIPVLLRIRRLRKQPAVDDLRGSRARAAVKVEGYRISDHRDHLVRGTLICKREHVPRKRGRQRFAFLRKSQSNGTAAVKIGTRAVIPRHGERKRIGIAAAESDGIFLAVHVSIVGAVQSFALLGRLASACRKQYDAQRQNRQQAQADHQCQTPDVLHKPLLSFLCFNPSTSPCINNAGRRRRFSPLPHDHR